MSIYVITYAGLLILLGLLTHFTVPEFARVTLITSLASGALCFLWGLLGLLGHRRRVGVVLTLIATSYVLLGQAVTGWTEFANKNPGMLAAFLVSLMVVGSVALLAYLLHAGATTNPTTVVATSAKTGLPGRNEAPRQSAPLDVRGKKPASRSSSA